MVDFDDVGRYANVLYELGSAFRSWCEVQKEEKSFFSLEYFSAAYSGYTNGSKNFLTDEEKTLIPRAIKIQCFQLASRFARDYFEGSYFRFDPNKYASNKDHSLVRLKECIDLYEEVVKKEKEMLAIINANSQ